ncbi:class I SAM-dependent methyltransferase [Kordiimonas marina]|uniref:class I SAM-dependent methyltransferase n=1 Tax=Kordiimonas marina TaxID=2872312 RepID=UPI001FF0EF56|nr:class I SAM-dependent methyltransferase [Kordiimonas marina]MCJ9429975.1 class I SAM-dependent methyltransferase [Kordiimonas marina]
MIALDIAPCENFNGYDSYVESRGNSDQKFWGDISRSQWMTHVEAQKTGQENKVRELLLPIAQSLAALRVISLGPGMAFGVNALLQAGIDAYGCNIGGRIGAWKDIDLPADRLFMADLTDLPLSDGQFGIAFLWHVFEHVGTKDGNQKMVSTTTVHRQKCIDQYHGAHTYLPEKIYTWGIKKGIGTHNPFSKKNFLPPWGNLKDTPPALAKLKFCRPAVAACFRIRQPRIFPADVSENY